MNPHRVLLFTFLSLLSLHFSVLSQRLPIRVFSGKDGLRSANPLLVDQWGFVWFGSEEGLTAYDGAEITSFGKREGLLNNVNAAAEDSSGTLWIGGRNGITRATRSASFPLSLRFTPVADDNENEIRDVRLIRKLSDGSIVFSAQRRLCVLRDGKVKELIVLVESIKDKTVYHPFEFSDKYYFNNILLDRNGNLWLTADSSLYQSDHHWRNGSSDTLFLRQLISAEDRLANWTGNAFFDSQGRLWLSTSDQMFLIVEPSLHLHTISIRAHGIRQVNSLLYNPENTLWIGDGDRLHAAAIVNENRRKAPSLRVLRTMTADDGIPPGSTLTSLVEDPYGTLWANTIWGSPLRVSTRSFRIFDASSLGMISLHKVVMGQGRRVWISDQNRMTGIFHEQLSSFNLETSVKDRTTLQLRSNILEFVTLGKDTFLLTDESGGLWLMNGSEDHPEVRRLNLNLKDPRGMYLLRPDTWVVKVFRDRDGYLWLSANQYGVYRCSIQGNILTILNFYSKEDGLPDKGIRAITQTRDGALWFGGWNDGLARYDGSSCKTFTTEDGLADNSIRSLYETPDGTLWIGTRYNGLCAFKDGKFYRYPSPDLLQCTAIWTITADETGRLWLATQQGLISFKPDPAFEEQPPIWMYDENDGLSTDPTYQVVFDRAGNLYVNTRNRLCVLPSAMMHEKSSQPRAYLRTIFVNGQAVFSTDSLHIRPSDQTVTFSFGAVGLASRGALLFQYSLVGFTSEWSTPSPERNVTFAKLPPGEYVFKVRTAPAHAFALHGDQTREEPKEITTMVRLSVAAPFWQAWWFHISAGLLFAGTLYGVYRYRVRKILEVERLRSRIAADLHDEVGSNLSTIALSSQIVAQRLGGQERERIKEIGDIAIQTSNTMKEIVWLLNPRNDSLDDLLLRMKTITGQMLNGIEYTFEGPEERFREKVSLERKRHLHLAYKEILNNVIKHAAATRVWITVRYEDGRLSLAVRDNGRGFHVADCHTGNGLKNLRARTEQINGTISIESSPGKGTSVKLSAEIT
jgi:signal transduction histidine kinase/ligand-binding sensor domain-containing protein